MSDGAKILGVVGAVVGVILAPVTGGASLAVAGAYLGAAVSGASIGMAIGGLIDPPKGPDEPVNNAPSVESLAVQRGSEGAAIPYCCGERNRFAGFCFWVGQFKSESDDKYGKNHRADFAVLIAAQPISNVSKIYENKKLIYDSSAIGKTRVDKNGNIVPDKNAKGYKDGVVSKKRWKSITIYKGGDDQPVDTLMNDYEYDRREGNDNGIVLNDTMVPAYNGWSYIVFNDYLLRYVGNQIPQLEFEIEETKSLSVGEFIEKFLLLGGYNQGEYDFENGLYYDRPEDEGIPLYNTPPNMLQVKGYTISGPVAPKASIDEILSNHFLGVSKDKGKLKFFQRKTAPDSNYFRSYISKDEISAHAIDDEIDSSELGMIIETQDKRNFPKELVLNYTGYYNDLQPETYTQMIEEPKIPVNKTVVVQTREVIRDNEAANMCSNMFWQKWNESKVAKFSLPPRFLGIQEGDVVSLTINDTEYIIRLNSIVQGYNLVHECDGTIISIGTGSTLAPYASYQPEIDEPKTSRQEILTIPDLNTDIIDIAPIRQQDSYSSVGYMSQAVKEVGETYLGAQIIRSQSAFEGYSSTNSDENQTISGFLYSSLEAFSGFDYDKTNKVQVELNYGEISSISRDEIDNNFNMAILGDEVICFRDVTPIDDNIYEISFMRRGLRDTQAISHSIGERFIMLDFNNVKSIDIPTNEIGAKTYYKSLHVDVDETDVIPIVRTNSARTLRELTPTDLSAVKESNNDWSINWLRRTRILFDAFGPEPVPIPDGSNFRVDIYSNDLKVREEIVNEESFLYTSSMQIADTGGILSNITIEVFQIGYNDLLSYGNKETF